MPQHQISVKKKFSSPSVHSEVILILSHDQRI